MRFSSSQRRAEIQQALAPLLAVDELLCTPEALAPYECDGLSAYRTQPLAVALPRRENQMVDILRVCQQLQIPLVPRGAGTSLSGGAMPHAEGIVLSTARMNRIVAIDPLARRAVVQPGVRNLAISEAAAPHGLYYAPDPSSQIACTIGGNLAENAGGVHCLKYGLTTHNVLAARAVLIGGEVVTFGSQALDAPGLDLLSVLIGSEGMLAVLSEITVKLIPRPHCARVILASFDQIETAAEAVASIIAAGILPAGLEMMDQAATQAVESFIHAGYDTGAAAILLCESDGTEAEVAEEIERMWAVLLNAGATRLAVSENEAERLRFWSGRKNAFPAAGRISPDYYCMDGTVPKQQIAPFLRAVAELSEKYRLRCINVFHAGDGNTHPLILFDGNQPGEWERAEAFGFDILECCIRLGGTITGEHGVGVEKIGPMCSQFSRAELDAFSAVKQAFDPDRLLNPEKQIPTLHRCAEYGRLHVHHGQLPHPELPRF